MEDILGEKKSFFCLQFHIAICCSREVTVVEAVGHIVFVVNSRAKQMHGILLTYFPIAFSPLSLFRSPRLGNSAIHNSLVKTVPLRHALI